MKFGTFLFPDCRDPAEDGRVIDETMREAMLADELGMDVVWLAEHHFDGISVYADPIGLAGALAGSLRHAGLGFAVMQTALHHPIRLAEQMALLDHLLKGGSSSGSAAAAPSTSTTTRVSASTITRRRRGSTRPRRSWSGVDRGCRGQS